MEKKKKKKEDKRLKSQKYKTRELEGGNTEHTTRQQPVYKDVQSTQEVQELVLAAGGCRCGDMTG